MVIIVVAIIVLVYVVTVIAVVIVVDISACLRHMWNPILDEGTRRQAETRNPMLSRCRFCRIHTPPHQHAPRRRRHFYVVIVIDMVTRTLIDPQPL